MRGFVGLSILTVLLFVLVVSAGQNTDEPAVVALVFAAFFIAGGIPASLGVALVRRDMRRRNAPPPTTYVTHQHLHVYQVDAAGQPELMDEQTRTLTTR